MPPRNGQTNSLMMHDVPKPKTNPAARKRGAICAGDLGVMVKQVYFHHHHL